MTYGIAGLAAGANRGVEQYREDKRLEQRDQMVQEEHETLQRGREQQYGIRADQHQADQADRDLQEKERRILQLAADAERGVMTGNPQSVEPYLREVLDVPEDAELPINIDGEQVSFQVGDQQFQYGKDKAIAFIRDHTDPGRLHEFEQNKRLAAQEAEASDLEFRRDIAGRVASGDSDRVSFDEEGNPVISDPKQNAEDLFSLAKINVRDVDPAVLAEAERVYNQTGDRGQALRILSTGVRSEHDRAFIGRMEQVAGMASEMLPRDAYNPVKRYVERNPGDAEAYGIAQDDPYGVALRKLEQGLVEHMGVQTGNPYGIPTSDQPAGGTGGPGSATGAPAGAEGSGGPGTTTGPGAQGGNQPAGAQGDPNDLDAPRVFSTGDGEQFQVTYREMLDTASELVAEGEDPRAHAEQLSRSGIPDQVVSDWYKKHTEAR